MIQLLKLDTSMYFFLGTISSMLLGITITIQKLYRPIDTISAVPYALAFLFALAIVICLQSQPTESELKTFCYGIATGFGLTLFSALLGDLIPLKIIPPF